MTSPLITIAIPFYNSEKFLPFAIQSVINQTYQNWELLLISDGGNDNSLQIAHQYAMTDKRIKVISDGKNKKLAARLNESVRLAKGKFYARMDDDDIMTIDRVKKQVDYLIEHPEVDAIGSSVMHINGMNEIVGSQDMSGVNDRFIHPTVMADIQWMLNNPYSEELPRAQDMDLWLRASRSSHFYNMPEPLLFDRNTGVPIVSLYVKSMQSLRLIANRYRMYDKTYFWGVRMKIKSYCQQYAYVLLDIFNLTDWLVKKRRIRPVSNSLILEKIDLSIAIKGIMMQ